MSEHIERIVVHKKTYPTDGLYLEHYFRYLFAKKIVKDMTVLDCACGTGYGAYILAEKAKEVLGVDNSSEALKIASTQWMRKNVEYGLLDIQNLKSLKRKFDAVVSFETIEHLKDPERFVDQVYDLLNEQGYFIVSTPNKETYRAELEPNIFHLHEFSSEEFVKLLSKKFKKVELFTQMAITDSSHKDNLSFKPFLRWLLKMKLMEAMIRNPVGYYLYLRCAQKMFSIVSTAAYHRYQYMIAVCQK